MAKQQSFADKASKHPGILIIPFLSNIVFKASDFCLEFLLENIFL